MSRTKAPKKTKGMLNLRYLMSKRWPKLLIFLILGFSYLFQLIPGYIFGLMMAIILMSEFYFQPLFCLIKKSPNAWEGYKKSRIISALSRNLLTKILVIVFLILTLSLGAFLTWNPTHYYSGLLVFGTSFMFLSWYLEQITRSSSKQPSKKR